MYNQHNEDIIPSQIANLHHDLRAYDSAGGTTHVRYLHIHAPNKRRESGRAVTGQPGSQSGRVVTALLLKVENETKSPTSLCHLQPSGYQPIGPSFHSLFLSFSFSLYT